MGQLHVFVRTVGMLKKARELQGAGSSSGKATGDGAGAKGEQADGSEPPRPRICVNFRRNVDKQKTPFVEKAFNTVPVPAAD